MKKQRKQPSSQKVANIAIKQELAYGHNENKSPVVLHIQTHPYNSGWRICVQRVDGEALGRAWVERDPATIGKWEEIRKNELKKTQQST